MRKIILNLAITLDGFLKDPKAKLIGWSRMKQLILQIS